MFSGDVIDSHSEFASSDNKVATTASLAIGVLHGGFIIPPWGMQLAGLRVLTDHEIFRRERRIRRARKYTTGSSIESLTALTPGDYVVHLEHGVGTVSYTHLRAHETPEHLVCRLL